MVLKKRSEKSKQYQRTSTKKMNNNAEYTRRYVQGVADGDAFSRSNRSLARAWNIYAKYVNHVQECVNGHFEHNKSQKNYFNLLSSSILYTFKEQSTANQVDQRPAW